MRKLRVEFISAGGFGQLDLQRYKKNENSLYPYEI